MNKTLAMYTIALIAGIMFIGSITPAAFAGVEECPDKVCGDELSKKQQHAIDKAEKAQAKADKAQDKADKAQDKADNAQEKADKSEIDKDQAKADKAQAKADKAQAKADKAQAKADKAQAKADKEKSKADKEKSKADKEKSKADKEKSKACDNNSKCVENIVVDLEVSGPELVEIPATGECIVPTYEVVLKNLGSNTAEGIRVLVAGSLEPTITPPNGFDGTLASGSNVTFTVTYNANSIGEVEFSVYATSFDVDLSNNILTTAITGQCD